MNESNLPAEQIRQLWLGGDHATLIQMFRGIENQRVLSGDEAHYYGRSLLELGETDRAVTLLSHAENGCSEGFWASLYLGRALRASGRELDGLSASERAAGLTENNWYFMSTVFSELAKIIETTGNPQIRGGALAVMSSLFNSAHAMQSDVGGFNAASPGAPRNAVRQVPATDRIHAIASIPAAVGGVPTRQYHAFCTCWRGISMFTGNIFA